MPTKTNRVVFNSDNSFEFEWVFMGMVGIKSSLMFFYVLLEGLGFHATLSLPSVNFHADVLLPCLCMFFLMILQFASFFARYLCYYLGGGGGGVWYRRGK